MFVCVCFVLFCFLFFLSFCFWLFGPTFEVIRLGIVMCLFCVSGVLEEGRVDAWSCFVFLAIMCVLCFMVFVFFIILGLSWGVYVLCLFVAVEKKNSHKTLSSSPFSSFLP